MAAGMVWARVVPSSAAMGTVTPPRETLVSSDLLEVMTRGGVSVWETERARGVGGHVPAAPLRDCELDTTEEM